jgi:hypothetical protein
MGVRTSPSTGSDPARSSRLTRVWLAALTVAAVAAITLSLFAIFGSSGGGDATTEELEVPTGQPTLVSEEQFREFGRGRDLVYWAGPRNETQLELTVSAEGHVFVRYLPADDEAGDSSAGYLTVATYKVDDAYERLVSRVSEGGFTPVDNESGALVVTDDADTSRAYFAFQGSDVQVEVFAPQPGRALELVLDGSLLVLR